MAVLRSRVAPSLTRALRDTASIARRLCSGRRSSPPDAGSQKWEPTCLAALGRSTTQPDSSRRSRAPSPTQSDGDRHPGRLWISLTRKRSLVQIQYGPRRFSKSCLALRAKMGARLLRLCPISAGHGPAIPASTQGVPAVSISSKPIAADAIECGNHAASQTSRTVNAARYAHIADSVLEVCWSATPMYGVHIGDSGAKPLPARKGLTGLRLCVTGAEFRACDVRDMSAHPGLRGRAVRRQDVHGRGRPAGGADPDRQPRGEAFTATRRQPFQPITTCQHFRTARR